MKYVLVSGGVVSGLGKGITASSVGALLSASGLLITSIKIDPYLNKDAGTMSPQEHGEVFVLDDGGETDLDLGNYERFLDITLTKDHNITTGKIYDKVIRAERRGDYLGQTVQVVPHITDAIQEWIQRVSVIPVSNNQIPQVCIIELGGTIGDIESMVFLEALRQFRVAIGEHNFCHLHVSLVPTTGSLGEQKSKPTQHSIRELRAAGLSPDIIVCRSISPLQPAIIQKISSFCMVPAANVISVHNVPNLYHVPSLLLDQGLPSLILGKLAFDHNGLSSIPFWAGLANKYDEIEKQKKSVRIGLVGKYNGNDSYLSIIKAIIHASIHCNIRIEIVWIDAENLQCADGRIQCDEWNKLKSANGILIMGGFGNRGVEEKISAANYARTNNIPFLGICLGFQVAVIEYARSVLGWTDANSTEFNEKTTKAVIINMPEISKDHMGGTMRLGSRKTLIKQGSLAYDIYNEATKVSERHRHRYEVNPEFVQDLEEKGLLMTGVDETGKRMEILELGADNHPFYVGVQFHPEFKSRPFMPSPPFIGLISAAHNHSQY